MNIKQAIDDLCASLSKRADYIAEAKEVKIRLLQVVQQMKQLRQECQAEMDALRKDLQEFRALPWYQKLRKNG